MILPALESRKLARSPRLGHGPNEALEYVQAYIDAPTVITRGTLEDHLAKLKASSGRRTMQD